MSDDDLGEEPVEAPQVVAADRSHTFSEQAARLVDLRGVARPPNFSGSCEAWSEFKFRMESMSGLLSLDAGMANCLTCTVEQLELARLSAEEATRSRLLYNLLVQICSGRASALLRLTQRGNGHLAWRKLCEEYEPSVSTRHLSMLVGVLTPRWSEDGCFTDQLMQWERHLAEYEAASGEAVPGAVRCAIVSRWAPERIKAWIRTAPTEVLNNYEVLKRSLESFISRGRLRCKRGAIDRAAADGGRRPCNGW